MVIESVVLSALLINIANKGLEKVFESAVENITSDAYSWFKSLFYKKDKPKKVMEDFMKNPNEQNLNCAKAIVINSIEDNEKYVGYLNEILQKVPDLKNTITNSKNIVIGSISTNGGNLRIGDNYDN